MTTLFRQPSLRCLLGAWLIVLMALPGQTQENAPDTLRETFRDWAVNCLPVSTEDGKTARLCESFQQVNHQETGLRILAFSVRIDEAGQPVAVLIAPFGLRLSEGARIRVGGQELASLTFETCLPEGCVLIAPMSQTLVEAMQNGSGGDVVMVTRQGEGFSVPVSLMGFTAALQRLRALVAN